MHGLVLKKCNVSTPRDLAHAIVSNLGVCRVDRWLEPCAGEGAFLRSLAAVGVKRSQITAVDLVCAPSPADSLGHFTRGHDFLEWSTREKKRFDRVVANPPYISLSKLSPKLRRSALKTSMPDGSPIPASSNYWHAFLCASLSLLKPGGSLAFVLPAAFEYANYSRPLLSQLPWHFRCVEVHRCLVPLFPTVSDGALVLICRGWSSHRRSDTGSWRRIEYQSPDELIKSLEFEGTQARATEIVAAVEVNAESEASDNLTCSLRDVLSVSIGAVTGDARYFLLTEAKRRENRLPISAFVPVVSRARHLTSPQVTSEAWDALRRNGERVWLFRPTPRVADYSHVRDYLELAPEDGGCAKGRHKVESRSPWYRTVLPKHVDGFMSGMSKFGPWISLRSKKGLSATNTLYTVSFRRHMSSDDKSAWALSLLATPARDYLRKAGRMYADGLIKFEPGDLLNTPLLVPADTAGAAGYYAEVLKTHLTGNTSNAQEMADSWLLRTSRARTAPALSRSCGTRG